MKNMDLLQILQTTFLGFTVVIALVAMILAYKIGQQQNEISKQLLKLQDYVAISATPGDGVIDLLNTGKSNLYLWGFDMPGNDQRFERPRLISASTNYKYWIPVPNLGRVSTTTPFEFTLYLTDEYGRKWRSVHGGEADPLPSGKGYQIKIWSYQTQQFDWSI